MSPTTGESDEERAHYGEGGDAKPDIDEEKARAEADKRAKEAEESPEVRGGYSPGMG